MQACRKVGPTVRPHVKFILDFGQPNIVTIGQTFSNDPIKITYHTIFLTRFETHNLHFKYIASYHCATMIYEYTSRIFEKSLFRYPISVISDIGLSLISESPISD
jgi:hypothetical protein